MQPSAPACRYDELPFALAQCFIEIPYTLGQDILFSACAYWMMGFDTDAGKFFWWVQCTAPAHAL